LVVAEDVKRETIQDSGSAPDDEGNLSKNFVGLFAMLVADERPEKFSRELKDIGYGYAHAKRGAKALGRAARNMRYARKLCPGLACWASQGRPISSSPSRNGLGTH